MTPKLSRSLADANKILLIHIPIFVFQFSHMIVAAIFAIFIVPSCVFKGAIVILSAIPDQFAVFPPANHCECFDHFQRKAHIFDVNPPAIDPAARTAIICRGHTFIQIPLRAYKPNKAIWLTILKRLTNEDTIKPIEHAPSIYHAYRRVRQFQQSILIQFSNIKSSKRISLLDDFLVKKTTVILTIFYFLWQWRQGNVLD